MINYFKEVANRRNAAQTLQNKYRECFLTPDGKDVLADILLTLGYGINPDPYDPIEVAFRNVGNMILMKLGIYGEDKVRDLIEVMSAIPPREH
jgi:hypothetical protein